MIDTQSQAGSNTPARRRWRLARACGRTQNHDLASHTCRSRCCSELIKTFGILLRGLRGDHALERKPSNAWARKMPALIRPRKAVTVSIIASFRSAPCLGQNDPGVAQSKGFHRKSENGI